MPPRAMTLGGGGGVTVGGALDVGCRVALVHALVRAQPGIRGAGPRRQMSTDGHGFELGVDPRLRSRKAAADAQRAFNAAQTASESGQVRADRDRLAADYDTAIERALTAARRARS